MENSRVQLREIMKTVSLRSSCQTHPGTRGSGLQSPHTKEPRTVSPASSLWDHFRLEELSSCPRDRVIISPTFTVLRSGHTNLPIDHVSPVLPQPKRDTRTALLGRERKLLRGPESQPLLTSTLGCKARHQGQPPFHNQPRSGNWGTSRSQDGQSPPERFKRKKKKNQSIIKFYQ